MRNTTEKKSIVSSRKFFIAVGAFVALGLVFALINTPAHAIRLSLKRIVFEGANRSEILTLINNSGQAETYRLGWRKYRMTSQEGLKVIEDGGETGDIQWADNMIRFAPRRVTVPPGSSQQVRLLLRRPKDLQEGEYRAHLWIVTESKPEAFTAAETNQQSVRLAVQPAVSLPIFVRHGNLSANASITETKLTRAEVGLNVAFRLNREGNRSVYGDFQFICKDGGQDLVLHQVRGLAVYTEIDHRYLDFDIPLSEATTPTCNTMDIVYRADPNDTTSSGILAKATASLQ